MDQTPGASFFILWKSRPCSIQAGIGIIVLVSCYVDLEAEVEYTRAVEV